MHDLSEAISAAPVATSKWIGECAVAMKIPGLGMPLTNASRQGVRQLDKVSWLLGHDAEKHLTLLFVKGDKGATFVGFGTAKGADITTTLQSLGLEPAAIMPDGQHRYGTDAINMLVRKAERAEALGTHQ